MRNRDPHCEPRSDSRAGGLGGAIERSVDNSRERGLARSKVIVSDVEFRSEVMYFIVVDRFCCGTPDKKGFRNALDDPMRQHWTKYWGGDLQGILNKLDYLQGMGVTALWLTPLFEQVESSNGEEVPLHGYWAQDFKRINARWVNDPSEVRLFTRNDTIFDELIQAMHERGMKLVLDIVCNHSSPETELGKGRLYEDGRLVADFNNDSDHWYHHYGLITDWSDEWQVQNGEIKGLATFNENNVLFRRYIKDAIRHWLDKGVDALRIDTVKHMPLWFWQEFNIDMQLHRPGVFIFGEWIDSHPENPKSTAFANHAGMTILDFGFCHAIRRCLGEGAEGGFTLVQELLSHDDRYRGATELVTFFENHDMPRLQSLNGDPAALELATALILTARGVPCICYGSEQYLHNDTGGGGEPYNRPMMETWDTGTPLYRLIQVLSEERHRNQAVQWGGHWPKLVEPDTYCFLRRYRDSRLLVILNKGPSREVTIEDTELPDGSYRCLVTGTQVAVAEGRMTLPALPEKGCLAFGRLGVPIHSRSMVRLQINEAPTQPGEWVAVIGGCPELGDWDVRQAVRMECVNRNMWFTELPFHESRGRPISYKYVILSESPDAAPRRENRTARVRAVIDDGVAKWRDIWEE